MGWLDFKFNNWRDEQDWMVNKKMVSEGSLPPGPETEWRYLGTMRKLWGYQNNRTYGPNGECYGGSDTKDAIYRNYDIYERINNANA